MERPEVRTLLGRLGVPVLPKPFAVDALLAAVEWAATQLADRDESGRR